MTQTEQELELEQAIAAAELTEDEAVMVRDLVAGGGQATAAIDFVVGERDTEEAPEVPEVPEAPEPESGFVVDDEAVEREVERHLAKMHDLLGPTAVEYAPCDECGGVGVLKPSEQIPANDKYRECPTCHGHAKVLTGSKDPQWVTQPCPTCAGRGFLERVAEAVEQAIVAGGTVVTESGHGLPAWMGNAEITPDAPPAGWR